jgi:hypothetical protein
LNGGIDDYDDARLEHKSFATQVLVDFIQAGI